MQFELQIFEYQDQRQFRTIEIDGAPWFVLADVCRALDLGLKNGSFSHHVEKLDSDERRLVARADIDEAPSPRRGEGLRKPIVGASLLVINESGLYSLILGSTKPEAKAFKKWVTSEVLPSIRRTGHFGRKGTPAFIRRFNNNWSRVSSGYFSVINELTIRLWGRLEQIGHLMADRAPDGKELRPDVSVGRLFSEWLQEYHPEDCRRFTFYMHQTNEAEFEARQYETGLLPHFINYVDNHWIPKHARDYFKTRDPDAVPHLPKLLPAADPPKPRLGRRRP